MTKIRIVGTDERGAIHAIEFEGDAMIELIRRGFHVTGLNSNPRQRTELQNQPKIEGYCGPMWDGDGIRYESAAAYRTLSA